MRFGSDQFYVKTAEEFERAFGHAAPDALANTLAIAERCNVKIELGVNKIPEVALPPGSPRTGSCGRWRPRDSSGGWRNGQTGRGTAAGAGRGVPTAAWRTSSPSREDRIRQLLLIVADFIGWRRTNGSRWAGPRQRGREPGRVLRTDHRGGPDPVQAPLRRFLNPERVSNPRLDCDFCKNRREEVIATYSERTGPRTSPSSSRSGPGSPGAPSATSGGSLRCRTPRSTGSPR